MIESYKDAPHFSHFLDVLCSWTFWASLVRKSLKNWLLHFLHFYKHLLPWSSAKWDGLNPDLTCNPSVFWEIKNFNSPAFSIATRAICVYDGIAFFESIMFLLGAFFTPWAFFSQAPGPVFKTVLTPDLKSGIPQAVDIPAPVKAVRWLDPSIKSAIVFIFSLRTY